MNKIAIILPVYNEAATIAATIREFHEKVVKNCAGAELIIAEDGSTDGTKDILRDLRQEIPFTLFSGEARKGYTRAFKDALKLPTAPLVFFSDSDAQHDPSDFRKLLEWTDRYDIVSGYKAPRRDPLYRVLMSRAYNTLIGLLFGIWLHDINSGFKIIRKEVIDAVLPEVTQLKQCVMSEFVLRAHLRGFKIKEVPVVHFSRAHGASMFTLGNLAPIVINILFGLWSIRRSRASRHDSTGRSHSSGAA